MLQDQWEEDYLEGDLEGDNAINKDTPRSMYFEEPPDKFALPRANRIFEHPSRSEVTDATLLLWYHYQYGHIPFQRL